MWLIVDIGDPFILEKYEAGFYKILCIYPCLFPWGLSFISCRRIYDFYFINKLLEKDVLWLIVDIYPFIYILSIYFPFKDAALNIKKKLWCCWLLIEDILI